MIDKYSGMLVVFYNSNSSQRKLFLFQESERLERIISLQNKKQVRQQLLGVELAQSYKAMLYVKQILSLSKFS